jgi:hypothetical protein
MTMADAEKPATGTPPKKEKTMKSTVRAGKHQAKAATQRFLPISEIHDDTVIMKNGGLRALLNVQALNFNLKSETEQRGIISGYEQFLNTVTFPVQVVVRSTKMNIDPYITSLRAIGEKQQNELLREQTFAYASFVEKIVDIAEIMQKRFYVVVPLDDTPNRSSFFSQIFSWFGIDDSPARALARRRRFDEQQGLLRDRVNIVTSGLHNVGLMTKRLNTQDLIELFYQIYNPQTAQEQRLPQVGHLKEQSMIL